MKTLIIFACVSFAILTFNASSEPINEAEIIVVNSVCDDIHVRNHCIGCDSVEFVQMVEYTDTMTIE